MRLRSNLMASPPGLGAVRLKTLIRSGRLFRQLGVLLVAANRCYCPNAFVGRSSEDRHKWYEQAGPLPLTPSLSSDEADRPTPTFQRCTPAFPWRAFTFHHSVTFDSSSDFLLVLASPVRVHFGFTISRGYGMAGPRGPQFADICYAKCRYVEGKG